MQARVSRVNTYSTLRPQWNPRVLSSLPSHTSWDTSRLRGLAWPSALSDLSCGANSPKGQRSSDSTLGCFPVHPSFVKLGTMPLAPFWTALDVGRSTAVACCRGSGFGRNFASFPRLVHRKIIKIYHPRVHNLKVFFPVVSSTQISTGSYPSTLHVPKNKRAI